MFPPDVEIRPRTTGEILDDAWRLYLAHAPRLLALSGLFQVPAAVALLVLLAWPASNARAVQLLLPALTAVLLPLSGFGSAACQAALRRLAEGKPVELVPCLKAGLRLEHAGARAVVLMAASPGLVFLGWTGLVSVRSGLGCIGLPLVLGELFWVGLVFWVASDLHASLAAGEGTLASAWQAIGRSVQLHPGRAAAVTISRLALHVFAVLNLHVFVLAGLWLAANLAGLDTALVGVLVSLKNPAYVLALVLLGWLLLAPYTEAAGYLLYVDLRARHEGLDLWYRVQRHFPTGVGRIVNPSYDRQRAGVIVLALVAGLLLPAPARANDERLAAVRASRQDVQQITEEVQAADPYPGSGHWAARLDRVAERLNQAAGAPAQRFRWFSRALANFPNRSRDGALQVLADLDRRLALVEESLALPRELPGPEGGSGRPAPSKEDIKKLLPPSSGSPDSADPAAQPSSAKPAEERQPVRRDDGGPVRIKQRGPGLIGPGIGGGLTVIGWMVLAGLLLAVLVLAGVLFRHWRRQTRQKPGPQTGASAPSLESIFTDTQQSVAFLWRRAEELAQEGHFLEAVRLLYLAVLAHLHRANLIRYERTLTNGEYVAQLRHAPVGLTALHEPFRQLVLLFDEKWYGERACARDDYLACRGLAEELRDEARLN